MGGSREKWGSSFIPPVNPGLGFSGEAEPLEWVQNPAWDWFPGSRRPFQEPAGAAQPKAKGLGIGAVGEGPAQVSKETEANHKRI